MRFANLTRVLVVLALLVACGYIWHLDGRGEWWPTLRSRFLLGIPWGTLITVTGVLAFYLFAQSGLHHWNDPVVVAFRSWSYAYLPGMLVSGFAHASPDHLVGNLIGTVVLAPIVEFAWGHYPPDRTGDERTHYPAWNLTVQSAVPSSPRSLSADSSTGNGGVRSHPVVRAAVIFPLVVVAVSIFTSVLALGWSLGFSGTVFAFGGFVVVVFPLTAVVSMFAITGVGITYRALLDPVLKVTSQGGTPGPPSWAFVNVQAHVLGFLCGALLGVVFLWSRNRRPAGWRVFLAALVFGIARNLWVLPESRGETYLQYRGIGLVFVLFVGVFLTAVVRAEDEPLVASGSRLGAAGSFLSGLVLVLLVGGATAVAFRFALEPAWLVALVCVTVVSSLGPLAVVVPDSVYDSPVTARTALVFGLVVVLTAVAVPSVYGNLSGFEDDSIPSGAVEIEDYSVAYAEETTHGRLNTTESGVIVTSQRRDVWIVALSKGQLARTQSSTITLGGFGWRETVSVNRTGWNVVGNDSVYAVDLVSEGRRVRSFHSSASQARPVIANHTIRLTPAADRFDVAVLHNGTLVGNASVPARNSSVTVGPLTLLTESDAGSLRLVAAHDGTRLEVARRE